MREVAGDVERWRDAGKRVAVATVISVSGSAPRGIGAALAVNEDGEIAGSVSGGCVEPDVIERGLGLIRASGKSTPAPEVLEYGISDDQNFERIGLSCGGEIRVLVDVVDARHDALLRDLRAGREALLAEIVAAPAERASLLGRAATWAPPAAWPGGLAPELDTAGAAAAQDLLQRGVSETRMLPLAGAGPAEVFFAAYPAPPALVIVGASHVAIPLSRIARVLGYRVTVVDAREAFATPERFPDVDELLVEWPDEALRRLPLYRSTAVAILTHDPKFDDPALQVALAAPVGYVGAIGSRGTHAQRDARLRVAGVPDDQIARIHSPIGIDIGAKTPEEIALAVMAQIVAAKHGR
ncbi:MAG TPA: XdhC/CoxI family protein [Ktedonobacterales bacterium]